MKIKQEGNYKSLNTFESDELPDFTVITGENGSGKSQLVQLFLMLKENQLPKSIKFEIEPDLKSIQVEGFLNLRIPNQSNDSWKNIVSSYFNEYYEMKDPTKRLIVMMIQNDFKYDDLDNKSIYDIIPKTIDAKKELDNLLLKIMIENKKKPDVIGTNFHKVKRILTERHFKIIEIAIYVAKDRGKDVYELIEADYFNTTLPDYFITEPNLFRSDLSSIFFLYAKRRYINRDRYLLDLDRMVSNCSHI